MYDKMARDLDDHGATFLKHGETSQSLAISDLFTVQDGSVRPILKVHDNKIRMYGCSCCSLGLASLMIFGSYV